MNLEAKISKDIADNKRESLHFVNVGFHRVKKLQSFIKRIQSKNPRFLYCLITYRRIIKIIYEIQSPYNNHIPRD